MQGEGDMTSAAQPQIRTAVQRATAVLRDARRIVRMRQLYGAGRIEALAGTAHRLVRPRRTILFGPQRPLPMYIVYKLCALLGYRLETDPRRTHDLAFRFCDATYDDSTVQAEAGVRIINGEARDVSKAQVQERWGSVAGYPLRIDPATYVGPAVCKANGNGAHDGRVVQCPIGKINPDSVYQRLIDNCCGAGMVMDYRVTIHGGAIPLVYLKYRPLSSRFVPVISARIEVVEAATVFTTAERATIIRFARAMGVDFGDMDVLRDAANGRIYAVDLNHTPFGPPSGLSPAQRRQAVDSLTESFRRLAEHPD
jgi:hypothetical protein